MADDRDDLDGCETIASDRSSDLADADIDAVVLFADVDPGDPAAVDARRAEWQELANAS